jgi:tape measure domain-containing protein
MALKIRDIFVSLGFEVDDADLTRLDKSLANVQKGVKGMTILFAGASIAIGGFLKAAGDFEQTEIAFETMLGSAEKAKELLDGLKEDARRTPFTLPGILDSAKRLLAMGIEADRLRDTIKILGDVSAGVGIDKLPQLTLALGQVSAATKLRGQEIRQFTEAGVPLLEELGRTLGKTAGEVQEMTSRGEVSFEDVRLALENLTKGSGRFANLMERQSKSFLGILSNIKDFIIINAIAIGKELLPQAKAIATEFLNILEINRKIIKARFVKFFKRVSIAMMVLFKVAVAVVEAIITLTDAFGGLGTVIKFATFAMLGFTAISTLAALGSMVILVGKLITGFQLLGVTIGLVKATALLIPILIGAALIALGLIVEDIVGFFQGKDSITGLIVESISWGLRRLLLISFQA